MRDSEPLIGALICLAVVLTAPWAAAFDLATDAELFGKIILKIEYLNADSDRPLEHAHYDRIIPLRESRPLTRTELKDAIQALYDTGSFSDIAAIAVPEGEGVKLQFRLRLSRYFNRFFVPKGIDLGGRSPAEAMGLPVGERFSAQKLQQATQAVLTFMREKGYYQAEVTPPAPPDGDSELVDTTFDVRPGELATVRSLVVQVEPEQERIAIRKRLGLKEGQPYRRDRFLKRLDGLKKYLVGRGFLEAEPTLKESYEPGDNSIALDLTIANFGQVRIAVEGFKIPKDEQRRLLPALSGEGLRPELLEEGKANLQEYLEERGYPEATVEIQESRDHAGVRLLRYVIDRGRSIIVSEVRFRNNRARTDADLVKAIQIQPSHLLRKSAYSVAKLDSDVEALQSLYRTAGYLEATVVPLVELLKDGEKLRITFECNEGVQARARSVTIVSSESLQAATLAATFTAGHSLSVTALAVTSAANQHLPAPALAVKMRLKEGGPYSPNLAEYDRQAILAAYNDAGFLQPAVSYRIDDSDNSDKYAVTFQITEGEQSFVDKIVVLGKERTRESVIAKRIKLKQDGPLSLGKMLETQQALYSTGVFDLVRVNPQNPESAAPYQNVIVRVQEARPLTLRYGFGYQEREKVRGILEVSDLNIFGLGQSVDLSLRGSAIEQAGILSFKQPQVRFLPVDSYMTFSGSKKQQISFDERRLDLSYQYSHAISNHTWNMLRYSFTNVRVSQVTPDLLREETPRNLSTISAFYVNDTRDNYLDPIKGFFTSTDLGFTLNHGGHGYYASLYTQNSYYRKLKGPLLMASSFRMGLLFPIAGDTSVPVGERIPISERFFAGGSASLRGFSTDLAGPLGLNHEPIGGNALLIGNLELRAPMVNPLELAVFYDGGNVFSSMSAIRLSEVSHTVGVGLRVKTPLGPIRIDYGVNLNLSATLRSLGYKQGHFFLTIGPPF
ncbi:MAG: BamA/TamA family outer membrane protein [Acidobacteriia bacterium]|nr:BamA/TamA family outer membrane protein [Terriglobia bacterium]